MQATTPSRIDRMITVIVLAVLVIGVFLVLQPFISAIVWAAILVATTWPLHDWLARRWKRSGLAATLMTLLILTVVVAPFVIVGSTLAENAERLATFARAVAEGGLPDPPAWVAAVPLVGESVATYWTGIAHDGSALFAELKRFVDPLRQFVFKGGAVVGEGLLQLTLSVMIAFFLYRDGEAIMARVRDAVTRIAPERGLHMLEVASATTRAVVYGILGTALAQGVLMAIGLYIVGVRAAPLLGLVTFFLSPVPIGPPLVWIPTGLWLIFSEGETAWGIFLLIWGALVVSSVDNVLKPMIISRGSDLPFILVMLGVFGGVFAFGFIGVFLGPVLLALGFALVKEWAVPAGGSRADAPP
ncbi:MAG: AI-2E family transporter [Burkholderiales bacterium]|nr:AI-2E family transporter [Burkholderiales bacterium]